MLTAYKYRIYPNKAQAAQIEHHFGCTRLVYNLALELKMMSYKTCSNCGTKREEEMPLSEREWHCKECNSTHDRDINAARNIKFMGIKQYKAGRRNPEEPVEMFAMAKSTKQEILYLKG